MKADKNDFVPVSHLKKRGWTDKLIAHLLGEPDLTKANPHYSTMPEMKLFKKERVEQAEASPEFQEAQKGREGRRKAAQKAVATKKEKIERYLEEVTIDVPQLEMEVLKQCACDHFNNRDRREREPASLHSDSGFLNRICVNYLRHCLTNYEEHLREIAGKVGAPDAYLEIKEMVLDAIAKRYEDFSDECSRQIQKARQESLATPPR